jgi:glutamate synthase (NADPH/NADH) small chain
VYERADRIGGLLRYGIPEFKMEKQFLDRRLQQMEQEGVRFRAGVDVGHDVNAAELKARYDAVVLTVGATAARDLPIPGRDAIGVHQAMEFLPQANRYTHGDYAQPPIHVGGKHVVIIGGGDTGADCLGTSHRQGAASVTQLEIMPRPNEERSSSQPWPTFPMLYKVTSAHEEGGERVYAVQTQEFLKHDDGRLRALVISDVTFEKGRFEEVPNSRREIPADFVFLAMGFTGVEPGGLVDQLGVELDNRGNIARNAEFATNVDGVFVAGDAGRGQSLIVWAIAEGRSAAAAVDRYLMGHTALPAPIVPTARSISV